MPLVSEVVTEVVKHRKDELSSSKTLPHANNTLRRKLKRDHSEKITKLIFKIFEQLPLDGSTAGDLIDIAIEDFFREPGGFPASGVVIAGFGQDDIYPSCYEVSVWSILSNEIQRQERRSRSVNQRVTATIMPFAQGEMVQAFMEGVDPRYGSLVDNYLKAMFDNYPIELLRAIAEIPDEQKAVLIPKLQAIGKQVHEHFKTAAARFRREQYIDPVINAVQVLPKDTLAEMAESLVNLTSFKRRMSMSAETVGGPIDVAVISKGDGFIWIKRKHYFKPELNHSFFENYFGVTDASDSKAKGRGKQIRKPR